MPLVVHEEPAVMLPCTSSECHMNTNQYGFEKHLLREQELRAAQSKQMMNMQNQVMKMNDILMKKFL